MLGMGTPKVLGCESESTEKERKNTRNDGDKGGSNDSAKRVS